MLTKYYAFKSVKQKNVENLTVTDLAAAEERSRTDIYNQQELNG